MSYTEINQEGGMPYGGMPYDEIVRKLEVTDPRLVSEVRGTGLYEDDPREDYTDYVRSEIIDWSPDDVFLESDHPRRDPSVSRTMLNMRYNGGRGPNDFRLPQHPELFIGFTGNDPRGASTDPRFDKARAHMAARARGKEVRMGHNVGHGDFVDADRPWGGMALEYDKQEMFRRVKDHAKWFPATKVGRPWGRNVVADNVYGVGQRRAVIRGGTEGLYVPAQDQPRHVYGQVGGHRDRLTGSPAGSTRRVDRRRDADTAPWRNNRPDGDLGVHRYARAPRARREAPGPGGQGGALAARTAGDGEYGAARAGRRVGRSAVELGRDLAAAARRTVSDHVAPAAPAGSYRRGGARPAPDRQASLQSVRQDHAEASNVVLANTAAIVRGAREKTSSNVRRAQGRGLAAGKMGTATGETAAAGTRGGLRPGRDVGAVVRRAKTARRRAPGADELTTHAYSSKRPQVARPVGATRAGGFATAREKGRLGVSGAPEFRGHTTSETRLGDDGHRVFGSLDGGPHTGGLSLGKKDINPSHFGDRGGSLDREGLGDSIRGGGNFQED